MLSRIRVATLAALLLLLLPRVAPAGAEPGPVVIFAVDGLEWGELLPLLRSGELPVLAKLMEAGRSGRLRTFEPTLSPVIWTSIATGKRPDQHGIRSFAIADPGTREIQRLFNGYDRRAQAFWNILSDRGRRVAVVGWWITYPVDPIDGVVVAQVNTLDQVDLTNGAKGIIKGGIVRNAPGQVHPPELEAEVLSLHDQVVADLGRLEVEIFGGFDEPLTDLDRRLWESTRWAFRSDATYLGIARRLAASGPPFDVLAVYVGGTDVVGHRFWRYLRPEQFADAPSKAQVAELADVVPSYYRYVDAQLGEILAARGGTPLVIVLSDHGMEAANTGESFPPDGSGETISGAHLEAQPGVLIVSGPGVRPGGSRGLPEAGRSLPVLGSVYDVLPTLLAHFGLPAGSDMVGRPLDILDVETAAPRPSYDSDPAWLRRLELRRPESVEIPAGDLRIEQLRALGYIE